jgi:hypothetical protein
MTLTLQEARVLDFCQRRPVVTLERVCSVLCLAPITVYRALKKHGYFSSINHNSRYYTLATTPLFADNGLWFYRSIAFSCHRTLAETLVTVVGQATAGATPNELAHLLRTPVHNLLARLATQQRLGRRRLGHRVVYLCSDPQQQERQWQQRQQAETARLVPAVLPEEVSLPLALSVLVELIRSPHASVASLVRSLRTKGLSVPAHQLQALMDHLQLEKKEAHCNSLNSFKNCFAAGKITSRLSGHFPRRPCTPSTGWPSWPRLARSCQR